MGFEAEMPWIGRYCVICRVELRDPHHSLLELYLIRIMGSSLEECEDLPGRDPHLVLADSARSFERGMNGVQ